MLSNFYQSLLNHTFYIRIFYTFLWAIYKKMPTLEEIESTFYKVSDKISLMLATGMERVLIEKFRTNITDLGIIEEKMEKIEIVTEAEIKRIEEIAKQKKV